MRTTFIPLITGGVVEITEGVKYATPWTVQEAIERAERLVREAQQYAEEALSFAKRGDADPRVLIAGAEERIEMARGLMAAVRAA